VTTPLRLRSLTKYIVVLNAERQPQKKRLQQGITKLVELGVRAKIVHAKTVENSCPSTMTETFVKLV